MSTTLRAAVASAIAAAGLLAGASPAFAGSSSDDPQFQDTTLGHVTQVGWCQAVSQSVGAGVIAGGAAAQLDCGPNYVWAGGPGGTSGGYVISGQDPSFQDTTLGHATQVGGNQVVSQSVGAGVIAGGAAWQG